jgi:hypothetical protein
MPAIIHQLAKNAMQSGRARTDQWMLEFTPAQARKADPLMGWSGSGDTQVQVKLAFPTMEAAKAYADNQGIDCTILPAPERKLKLQTYADNFR